MKFFNSLLWVLIGLWMQPVSAGYAQEYKAEIDTKAFNGVKKQAEKLEAISKSPALEGARCSL